MFNIYISNSKVQNTCHCLYLYTCVTVCHLVMFSAGRSSLEGIMLCLGWPMKMAESQRSHTFPGSKWSNVTCSNKTWAYCMCLILTCSCRSQMGVIKHDVGELIQPWRCLSTSLNNLSHLKLWIPVASNNVNTDKADKASAEPQTLQQWSLPCGASLVAWRSLCIPTFSHIILILIINTTFY